MYVVRFQRKVCAAIHRRDIWITSLPRRYVVRGEGGGKKKTARTTRNGPQRAASGRYIQAGDPFKKSSHTAPSREQLFWNIHRTQKKNSLFPNYLLKILSLFFPDGNQRGLGSYTRAIESWTKEGLGMVRQAESGHCQMVPTFRRAMCTAQHALYSNIDLAVPASSACVQHCVYKTAEQGTGRREKSAASTLLPRHRSPTPCLSLREGKKSWLVKTTTTCMQRWWFTFWCTSFYFLFFFFVKRREMKPIEDIPWQWNERFGIPFWTLSSFKCILGLDDKIVFVYGSSREGYAMPWISFAMSIPEWLMLHFQ